MTYTEPLLSAFLLVAFLGLVRLRKSKGIWIPGVAFVGLLLVTLPAADWLLSRPLEARYPIRPFVGGSADAIVVLSASILPAYAAIPFPMPDRETFERCEMGAWLHTQWNPLPVLLSGGARPAGKPPNADTMRELVRRAGVPENLIWIEPKSQNTHENAKFSAEILRSKGVTTIVLVTDAKSMLRAELAFRKEGVTVIPAPSSFRRVESVAEEFVPSWKAVYRNEITLHETLGLAWYWLNGWI